MKPINETSIIYRHFMTDITLHIIAFIFKDKIIISRSLTCAFIRPGFSSFFSIIFRIFADKETAGFGLPVSASAEGRDRIWRIGNTRESTSKPHRFSGTLSRIFMTVNNTGSINQVHQNLQFEKILSTHWTQFSEYITWFNIS